MIRSSLLATATLILLPFACDNNASDAQKKADNAQAVAETRITGATVEANEKIASAQAEADKKVAEAQASFTKMREDYRHDVTDDLAGLDERVSEMEATEKTLHAKAKADLDARLQQIHASRAAVAADFASLESAPASTWDASKAQIEKEMHGLKELVDRY